MPATAWTTVLLYTEYRPPSPKRYLYTGKATMSIIVNTSEQFAMEAAVM